MANRNRSRSSWDLPLTVFRGKNAAGFTLIELMVVVAIIAFIISIAVVNYSSANIRARDGKRRTDLEQVRSALEIYRADTGNYPNTDFSGLLTTLSSYINPWPVEPLSGCAYYYQWVSATQYRLCANFEGTSPSACGNPAANCTCGTCDYGVTQP